MPRIFIFFIVFRDLSSTLTHHLPFYTYLRKIQPCLPREDAAWKLACKDPTRVRELLLDSCDDGRGEAHGCVVPFNRPAAPGAAPGTR